jgi:hypothetical protein
MVNSDPTIKFQTKIRNTIKESNYLIQQSQKWKYINLNPTAPTIKGLIKIHKPDHPIKPIVNWTNAPAYKLAKLFNNTFNKLSPLPFICNTKNTTHLIHDFKETPINENTRLASLDITNMYTNIPITETKNNLETIMINNLVDTKIIHEILTWYNIITHQNYFSNNNDKYLQQNGLAMGAPSSAIISEILLQYTEFNSLIPTIKKHNILGYYRYVDDILILFRFL